MNAQSLAPLGQVALSEIVEAVRIPAAAAAAEVEARRSQQEPERAASEQKMG